MSHELVAQKLTAAGLSFTVKDETQKIAQMPGASAVKSAHRFKVAKEGLEEPIGVTVVEITDANKKAEIQALFDMQSKMIEQISPGKYNQASVNASAESVLIMMNFRKSDQAAADSMRKVLED